MKAIYIAMEAEAAGLLTHLEAEELPRTAIGDYYQASLDGEDILIVTAGKDRATGVDCVGTEPAAIIAHELITQHHVTELYNFGTCGAHSSLDAEIGEAFLVSPSIFSHDHRIPLPHFEDYGMGGHHTPDHDELAIALDLRTAILSTGNSLDHTESDLEIFLKNGAQIKDMEGAALAWVCNQHRVPLTCLKVVTDIFDAQHTAAEQFVANLQKATAELTKTAILLLDEMN